MKTLFLLFSSLLLMGCLRSSSKKVLPAVLELTPSDSISLKDLGVFEINAISLHDSTFFLVSRKTKEIVKTDLQFLQLNRYQKIGKGPGELSDPIDLTIIGNRVFVVDFVQRKILEFDDSLNPIIEFVSEKQPMTLLAIRDDELWMGTFDLEFEDVYSVNPDSRSFTRLQGSLPIKYPPEGIADHTKNAAGDVLRYRYFNHRADLFLEDGTRLSFDNTILPQNPDLDTRIAEAPVFKWKTHHSAFLTATFACFLSDSQSESSQPVQCYDFHGRLDSLFDIRHPSKISVYADSTLYTYSANTNHIYVYDLGF